MITFKTLEHISIEEIHQAFVLAFSDYQVPLSISQEALYEMLIRRGYNGSMSMGAFDEDKLVAFVLNGVRDWEGKVTAYDTGTGVIPDYRRQGIMRQLMDKVVIHLRERNVTHYLLEVLQMNEGAISLYKAIGFQETRSLDCFRLQLDMSHDTVHIPTQTSTKQKHLVLYWEEMILSLWAMFQSFWDANPSWQNSIDSVMSLPEHFLIGVVMHQGTLAGYGIINPKTGDIPQLAVHKEHRRQGIGTSILHGLIEQTEHGKISVMNVDSDCVSLQAFLKHHQIPCTVSQFEMERSLIL